ncbi:MAG: hypothetical protein HRU02_11975 [Myxococcales bacterium]|nr:hypothetical protein [Myxococcales bacterium]
MAAVAGQARELRGPHAPGDTSLDGIDAVALHMLVERRPERRLLDVEAAEPIGTALRVA